MMDKDFREQIGKSRILLQNPYAYLGANGDYEAVCPDRAMDVHEERRLLQDPYAFLDEHGNYTRPHEEGEQTPVGRPIRANELLGRWNKGRRFKKQEIAEIAKRLQRQIWNHRAEIWPSRKDISPLEVLDPEMALKCIGYTVDIQESLGRLTGNRESSEIAGIINADEHVVHVSRRFDPRIRKFTMAHELGHAVLHSQTGLHRDRPVDGTPGEQSRSAIEIEADIFAAFFLLPERQVRSAFEKLFLTSQFRLTEDTAFALNVGSLQSLQDHCRTLRDLSRFLADTRQYNGMQFYSLAEQFGVSVESIAIRLEELDLVRL